MRAAFRISAIAVVTASALVVPAVAASAWTYPTGRAPVVSEAGTSDPATTCAVGAERPWVRSTAPTLRATLSDPDGQAVRATFAVLDSRARVVWAPPATAAQASGAQHAVQVPEGRLQDGGTYTWLVTGRDAGGRWGLPTICQFGVDAAAPAIPVVTPVAGEPAVYVEDASSGGVGQRGSFALSDEAADVVAYRYSFDSSALDQTVAASSPTITYTPTTSGPHTLEVQAVDRAGNVSPSRLYRFTVTPSAPTGGGRWLLDEGAGSTASSTGSAAPLTLTPSTTWTAGPLAEFGSKPADRALLLDDPADGAAAAGPVVDTSVSFTVSAFVRLDTLGARGTAVSQDGSLTSGFALGYDTTGCADGAPACWTFGMARDEVGADAAVVRSEAPASTGSWVQLTGVYDRDLGTVDLYVCEVGTPDAPGSRNPEGSSPVDFSATWSATGPFRLGQGFDGDAPFGGAVSSVAVTEGVAASLPSIRRSCSAGA
ncbi:LamG domain-containing protein [Cellulomonas fengjieae]|uniref:LamG domain-containing protein n=1 Tax=Cellulomonas fengjieae TaxID=2819978 RepID=A0ABS3SHN2_9CELL|nr:LamG domain-containing protein [Cellulomonas fengjieae]MBO3085255.1 LamG domain-containing protein [Cellulomonas fengjieae]QVI66181.1 LamG domain-containing protein [Cellulomonas fengjieae]